MKKFFVLMVAVAIVTPLFAFAATIKGGDEVFIQKGEDVRDNLYLAGGNVSVSGAVFGDLLAAGGNILISENVSDDMAIAGGSITILGNSGGDVRVAGGNILIAGDVAGDVVIAGGSVTIASEVSVGKDVVVAGGQVSVDGDVSGNLQITGGVATINGHIKGNVKAEVDEKLTLGSGAVVDGTLEYSARNTDILQMNEGAVVAGEVSFTKVDVVDRHEAKNFIFAAIGAFIFFKLIALIIAVLVLVWLFRKFSNSVVEGVVKDPLQMLGKGFVAAVVVPAAAILLFVTVVGIPLGLLLMFGYGLLSFVVCLYAGVVVGAWVSKLVRKSGHAVITYKNAAGGVVLLMIVKFIPLIGWIIGLFVFLVTLGSIVDMIHKRFWKER